MFSVSGIKRSSPNRFLATGVVAILAFVLVFASSEPAYATPRVQIKALMDKAKDAKRARAIKRARNQRVKPAEHQAIYTRLAALMRELGAKNLLTKPAFRDKLARAPLQVRLKLFKDLVKSRRDGTEVRAFDVRFRGMLKAGKKTKVSKPMKTVFEVTPDTLDLMHQVLGENVVWFAANPSPGHLHTLVADQDGGPQLTHNTYGEYMRIAEVGQYSQYAAPVLLTDRQMNRFTRYLNAGADSDRASYGFKKSNGEWVCQTACTNWATTAPIGDRLRWVRTLDRRVAKMNKSGGLPAAFADGLHAALAKAETKEARDELITQVEASRLSKWTKASAVRLGKEFDTITTKFPARPRDLVARETLSQTIGLNRSQDPAKWMFDLFMSKKVPVIGILNAVGIEDGKPMDVQKGMTFDLQIMGNIDGKGRAVKKKDSKSLGALPTGDTE